MNNHDTRVQPAPAPRHSSRRSTRRRFVAGAAVLAGLCGLTGLADPAGAAIISVNFVGGQTGNTTSDTTKGGANVTGTAGANPAANWNNEGPSQQTTAVAINDSTNTAAAMLSYSAGNNWAATGTAPGGGTNADLMSGYLDNFQASGSNAVVTGLGSAFTSKGYQVLVYQNADSAGSFGYSITDNAGHTVTAYGQQLTTGNTNYPLAGGTNGFIGSTSASPAGPGTAANYVILNGLTGSNFTLTGLSGTTGDGRARPNGFQIVSVPEPASLGLFAAGGLALLARRRRLA